MLDRTSILFVTLDSCRYDSFSAAAAPHIKRLGPVHRAMAPGNFTYASHAAMFMGFTPGVASRAEPLVNPKYGKIFKIAGAAFPSKGTEFLAVRGRNVIDGLRRIGFTAVGAGAAGWFDPDTLTGQNLTEDFDHFFYPGNTWSLDAQLRWLQDRLDELDGERVFCFLNVGETHVPYWHEGCGWSKDNPCVPFGENNDADECRRRQLACIEWVDARLEPLLARFAHANTLVCADHGDAWGEDGLWEHGIHHDVVLEVPLVFRLQHPPRTVAGVAGNARVRARGAARGLLGRVRDKLR
ncbi:MAG: hypothetical protein D6798_15840 [Deltaproteobacteria bacterium]|nr:MAG: hypothetical protein D6798_15840 [Deltaproteobacteria bacterium]